MGIFQKIVFPFSITGGVCYLYEYENTLVHKTFNEQSILQEIENLNIREISSLVFYGFVKEEKLTYYKRKLELHNFHCYHIASFKQPNPNQPDSLINVVRDVDLLIQLVGTKNFGFFYPQAKEYEVLEYITCALLFLDPQNELEEILEYFLGEKSLPYENLERLKFFHTSLKTSYSPVLKKFILQTTLEPPTNNEETLEINKLKVGEFELDLSSLSKNGFVEFKREEIIQKLNLNSLISDEDTFENPLELLEDVLDFAESFEEQEEIDEWKEAFPDTGKKVESNQSSQDELQSQKPAEILKSEEQEDYTFSSIDIDAITESYLSLEESQKENFQINDHKNISASSTLLQEDTISNLQDESLMFEVPLDFTSETMQTIQVEVEIASEPSLTSLDRQIKDALTKEVLIEEDPRKKKEHQKKESKPVTIIVTPEKKEEKLSPLSKEKLESLREEFNAIQLD